jgi:hypothetical protein
VEVTVDVYVEAMEQGDTDALCSIQTEALHAPERGRRRPSGGGNLPSGGNVAGGGSVELRLRSAFGCPRDSPFNKRYVRALKLVWTCPTSVRRSLPVIPTAVI